MIENNNNNIGLEQEDYEVDLRKYLNICIRSKRIIFIITFLGTLLGIIYTLTQKPIYKGRFQVVVDAKKDENTSYRGIAPLQSFLGGDSNLLKTEENVYQK